MLAFPRMQSSRQNLTTMEAGCAAGRRRFTWQSATQTQSTGIPEAQAGAHHRRPQRQPPARPPLLLRVHRRGLLSAPAAKARQL